MTGGWDWNWPRRTPLTAGSSTVSWRSRATKMLCGRSTTRRGGPVSVRVSYPRGPLACTLNVIRPPSWLIATPRTSAGEVVSEGDWATPTPPLTAMSPASKMTAQRPLHRFRIMVMLLDLVWVSRNSAWRPVWRRPPTASRNPYRL